MISFFEIYKMLSDKKMSCITLTDNIQYLNESTYVVRISPTENNMLWICGNGYDRIIPRYPILRSTLIIYRIANTLP